MDKLTIFALVTSLLWGVDGVPECDDDWANYKDELCIKTFENVATYEEAEEVCLAQGTRGSLVTVQNAEMQQFLVGLTQRLSDHMWLDGKLDGETSFFLGQDGTPLKYTNWQDGYPQNITHGDACIEMRPGDVGASTNATGVWVHVTCKKRNLIMCQKALRWKLNDAVAEILRMRTKVDGEAKTLAAVRRELEQTKITLTETVGELDEARRHLEETNLKLEVELQRTKSQVVDTQHSLNQSNGVTNGHLEKIKTQLSETNIRIGKSEMDIQVTSGRLNSTRDTLEQYGRQQSTIKSDLEGTKSDLAQTKTQLSLTTSQLSTTSNQLVDTRNQLTSARSQITDVKNSVNTVTRTAVPVGFIYIEYYGQPNPRSLWPSFSWQDVSSTYSGLFFRATGTGSDSWGSIQSGCAPRITKMEHSERSSDGSYTNGVTIPSDGWSPVGDVGENVRPGSTVYYEGLQLYTTGCEVRPRNQAIRIWKRTS